MAPFEEFFKNLFGRGPLAPTLAQTLLQAAPAATQAATQGILKDSSIEKAQRQQAG